MVIIIEPALLVLRLNEWIEAMNALRTMSGIQRECQLLPSLCFTGFIQEPLLWKELQTIAWAALLSSVIWCHRLSLSYASLDMLPLYLLRQLHAMYFLTVCCFSILDHLSSCVEFLLLILSLNFITITFSLVLCQPCPAPITWALNLSS